MVRSSLRGDLRKGEFECDSEYQGRNALLVDWRIYESMYI